MSIMVPNRQEFNTVPMRGLPNLTHCLESSVVLVKNPRFLDPKLTETDSAQDRLVHLYFNKCFKKHVLAQMLLR